MRYIPDIPEGWFWLLIVLLAGSCNMVENHQNNDAEAKKYTACIQYSADHSSERCRRETE